MTDQPATSAAPSLLQKIRAEEAVLSLEDKRKRWELKHRIEAVKLGIYLYMFLSTAIRPFTTTLLLEVLSFLLLSAFFAAAYLLSIAQCYKKKTDLWHESADLDGLDREVWRTIQPVLLGLKILSAAAVVFHFIVPLVTGNINEEIWTGFFSVIMIIFSAMLFWDALGALRLRPSRLSL